MRPYILFGVLRIYFIILMVSFSVGSCKQDSKKTETMDKGIVKVDIASLDKKIYNCPESGNSTVENVLGDYYESITIKCNENFIAELHLESGASEYNRTEEKYVFHNGKLVESSGHKWSAYEYLHSQDKSKGVEVIDFIHDYTTGLTKSRRGFVPINNFKRRIDSVQFNIVDLPLDSILYSDQIMIDYHLYRTLSSSETKYTFVSIKEYPYFKGHLITLKMKSGFEERIIAQKKDDFVLALLNQDIKKGEEVCIKWENRTEDDETYKYYISAKKRLDH